MDEMAGNRAKNHRQTPNIESNGYRQ